MASKEQFEFFKSLYENEQARHASLIDRGKVIISLITLYTAFSGATISDGNRVSVLQWMLFAVSVLSMLTSFCLAMLAIGVHRHQIPNDPKKIIESSYGDAELSNEKFFDHRIADFVVSSRWNRRTNDTRAGLLTWSTSFLLVALGLHASYSIFKLMPLHIAVWFNSLFYRGVCI